MIDQVIQPEPKKNIEAFQALLEIDEKERSYKARQGYYRAYAMSILFPPLGIYYLIKYVFFANGTNDDFKAGIISLVLTIVSLLATAWIFGLFFKQATSSLNPSQSNDILKQFITPENQKTFKNLMQ